MKIYTGICLLLVFLSTNVHAQLDMRQKTDSLAPVIQRYYNNKAYDSIYQLGGERFHQSLSAEKFQETMTQVATQLGAFDSYTYESMQKGASKYKAVFANAVISLYLSVDSAGKLETFFFGPYQPDSPPAAFRKQTPAMYAGRDPFRQAFFTTALATN